MIKLFCPLCGSKLKKAKDGLRCVKCGKLFKKER